MRRTLRLERRVVAQRRSLRGDSDATRLQMMP